MSTPQPCFYFRWLTRRHLHVSAKIASDSVKLVEPLSKSSKRPARKRDRPPRKRRRKVTGPSLLVESKVKDFLEHVESIKDTLGLEDLERFRPDRQPVPTSPEFEEQYNDLRDKLCHAFNKHQLQSFLKLYGLDFPTKHPKIAHVTMIMENAWSWPSLERVKKERIDWTVSSQRSSYLLPPARGKPFNPCSLPYGSQTVLSAHGKRFLQFSNPAVDISHRPCIDGTNLLNISKNYNVHVALLSNPLSLRVEGLNGALKQFEAYLNDFCSVCWHVFPPALYTDRI